MALADVAREAANDVIQRLRAIGLRLVIAAIAIVLDSQILVIGAMVLGSEFGAVAALGVALVRRRFALLGLAVRTLALGLITAIAIPSHLPCSGVHWAGLLWMT